MNGIVNIYKPAGITSHSAVNKVRRILGIKKVGHTGTLDPDAEGVLPICIGKGTKLAGLLTDADKAYRAVIKLGIVTDTQDASGEILSECSPDISEREFADAVNSFIGKTEQIPPMYSALKVNGRKLCDLARQGIEVERKPREITIFSIEISAFDGQTATLDVACSKGTYIRTLCHDIGQKLGCGAIMQSLIRTKSGVFEIKNSVSFEEFEKNPEKFIMPPDKIFSHLPEFIADESQTHKIKNGIRIDADTENGKTYRVYSETGEFLAVSESENGKLVIKTAFFG
ncbi:MAG: tRNA pseudouridine(55) synthase TruB [Monoglobales bacterium]